MFSHARLPKVYLKNFSFNSSRVIDTVLPFRYFGNWEACRLEFSYNRKKGNISLKSVWNYKIMEHNVDQ